MSAEVNDPTVGFERVRLGVGLLVMLGCLGVGFGVHDLYPFSSFSMYAGVPYSATSRIVAVKGSQVTDPQDLVDWRCAIERPDGERPDGEQPNGEQPNGEQPNGEQPNGEQPNGEQPNGEQPNGELLDSAGECPDHGSFYRLRYRDVDALRWVRRHPGDGHTPVILARRIWTLGPPGQPPTHKDCVIARCQASPAP